MGYKIQDFHVQRQTVFEDFRSERLDINYNPATGKKKVKAQKKDKRKCEYQFLIHNNTGKFTKNKLISKKQTQTTDIMFRHIQSS